MLWKIIFSEAHVCLQNLQVPDWAVCAHLCKPDWQHGQHSAFAGQQRPHGYAPAQASAYHAFCDSLPRLGSLSSLDLNTANLLQQSSPAIDGVPMLDQHANGKFPARGYSTNGQPAAVDHRQASAHGQAPHDCLSHGAFQWPHPGNPDSPALRTSARSPSAGQRLHQDSSALHRNYDPNSPQASSHRSSQAHFATPAAELCQTSNGQQTNSPAAPAKRHITLGGAMRPATAATQAITIGRSQKLSMSPLQSFPSAPALPNALPTGREHPREHPNGNPGQGPKALQEKARPTPDQKTAKPPGKSETEGTSANQKGSYYLRPTSARTGSSRSLDRSQEEEDPWPDQLDMAAGGHSSHNRSQPDRHHPQQPIVSHAQAFISALQPHL